MDSQARAGIDGLLTVDTPFFPDGRGSFREVFRSSWFGGVFGGDLQVNCTRSRAGVLRGLHYHLRQHDLWFPVEGDMLAGFIDLRPGSPTLGVSASLPLSAGSGASVLIPPGVAHGYLALTDCSMVYVVNALYDGSDEYGTAWDDPENGIDWGVVDPVLSGRDSSNPPLSSAGPLAFRRKAGI